MCTSACASAPPRDSVPEGSRDTRVERVEGAPDYEHLARRAHVTVALAESRGLDRTQVAAAIESLADRLEACTRGLAQDQAGVVRVVARVGDDGVVDGLSMPVQTGHAPTALRCLVAPVKLLVLHVSKAVEGGGTRGFALEAEWRP